MRRLALLVLVLAAAACGGGGKGGGILDLVPGGNEGKKDEVEGDGGPRGPDGELPAPYPCTGTSTACEGHAWLDCPWELGCAWEASTCEGTPTPCAAYANWDSCISEGCDWDDDTFACTGEPWRLCEPTESSDFCANGCTFTPGHCFAEADACTRISDEATCVNSGCTWDERG